MTKASPQGIQRLNPVVDRTIELSDFDATLRAQKPDGGITSIYGPSGIGKSLLLAVMNDQCHKYGIDTAVVEWRESRRKGADTGNPA